ncbi:MAG: hypothetical protein OHK006_11390 [Thermodesulfovibrionales bacterium]
MGVLDYFRKVKVMSSVDVRKLLQESAPGAYNLVDVRQPREYETGHIPGAKLIPLGELPGRLSELDKNKPTVLY